MDVVKQPAGTVTIEPGQPTAAVLELVFWEAIKRCVTEGGPLKVKMCDDDDSGGISFGRRMPPELWAHMADALAELRSAVST